MMRRRDGSVLLSTLWFLTGVVSLGVAAMLLARDTVRTVANRTALRRAEWRAEECLARARAAFEARSRAGADAARDARAANAMQVREAVLGSALVAECPGVVDLVPLGATLNVNHARESLLARTLRSYGVNAAEADSLVDALLDWRDADDSARAFGAERAWYASRGEMLPRNGPLADVEELRSVRGFAAWMGTDGTGLGAILGVDGERVFVEAVPLAVLAALPGMNAAATTAIERRRTQGGEPFAELLSVVSAAPLEARPALEAAFGELGDMLTVRLEGWVLTARASGVREDPRSERLTVRIELLLVPDAARLAVTRRRIGS